MSVVLLFKNGYIPFKRLKEALTAMPHFYVAGCLLVCGSLFINLAIIKLPITELNILGMITFPVTIVSARIFYKEKPNLKEWAGILFIVISILYLIMV